MHNGKSGGLVGGTKDAALIALGILSAGFGLKGFLLSSHFIDGGVTGVSLLLANVFRWPLYVSIPILNVPFIAAGYRLVGRAFAVKSALAMGGLTLCLAVVPYPDVTHDLLLTAVFGGLFIGAGIGLAIRGGAVLDGTEIAALLLSSRTPLLKVSDVILLLNIVIFGTAIFFLGVEPALYSILTYVAASKAIDFIVSGIEQYTGVTIVSERSDEIRRVITEELGRGVTLYAGKRGFGKRGGAPRRDRHRVHRGHPSGAAEAAERGPAARPPSVRHSARDRRRRRRNAQEEAPSLRAYAPSPFPRGLSAA
jgi:uncharacterized membrane-anchored protein YitT (DUF2179 family)